MACAQAVAYNVVSIKKYAIGLIHQFCSIFVIGLLLAKNYSDVCRKYTKRPIGHLHSNSNVVRLSC